MTILEDTILLSRQLIYLPPNMTQQEQILWLLRQGATHRNTFLNSTLGAEYRARISELRAKGYGIPCNKKTGIYTLVYEPEHNGQLNFVGSK